MAISVRTPFDVPGSLGQILADPAEQEKRAREASLQQQQSLNQQMAKTLMDNMLAKQQMRQQEAIANAQLAQEAQRMSLQDALAKAELEFRRGQAADQYALGLSDIDVRREGMDLQREGMGLDAFFKQQGMDQQMTLAQMQSSDYAKYREHQVKMAEDEREWRGDQATLDRDQRKKQFLTEMGMRAFEGAKNRQLEGAKFNFAVEAEKLKAKAQSEQAAMQQRGQAYEYLKQLGWEPGSEVFWTQEEFNRIATTAKAMGWEAGLGSLISGPAAEKSRQSFQDQHWIQDLYHNPGMLKYLPAWLASTNPATAGLAPQLGYLASEIYDSPLATQEQFGGLPSQLPKQPIPLQDMSLQSLLASTGVQQYNAKDAYTPPAKSAPGPAPSLLSTLGAPATPREVMEWMKAVEFAQSGGFKVHDMGEPKAPPPIYEYLMNQSPGDPRWIPPPR